MFVRHNLTFNEFCAKISIYIRKIARKIFTLDVDLTYFLKYAIMYVSGT